ncbi:MAG TPA: hypothetical protein VK483_17005 [Chitinophagaceae bacterium]|nr:hypothetical protein [Chitinophagaceae bacterium]
MPTTNFIQTSPKIKNLRTRFKNTLSLAVERAAGHLDDPQKYPLPGDNKSLEHAVYNIFASLSDRKQRKIFDRIKPTLQASSTKRKELYGDLSSVSLTSVKTITEQVTAIAVPQNLQLTQEDLDKIKAATREQIASPKNTGYSTGKSTGYSTGKNTGYSTGKKVPTTRAAVVVNPTLAFFVDSISCQKTSEVRKDEVSVTGFASDSNNVQQDAPNFFSSDFKKDESATVNQRIFNFILDGGSVGDPVTASAGLFLLEKDLISNVELARKLEVFFVVLGATFVAIGVAILIIGLAGGPVTVAMLIIAISLGMIFQFIGFHVFAVIADDFSTVASDTITLAPPFNVGDRFDRTLSFELENHPGDLTIGKYTAAVHWEVVAS